MIAMNSWTDILFKDFSVSELRLRAQSSFGRFATWWIGEFYDLLPENWIDRLQRHISPELHISATGTGVQFDVAGARGQLLESGHIDWPQFSMPALDQRLADLGFRRSGLTIGLILPESDFFCRSYNMPSRARPRLDVVAPQDLERRTPFRLDDVHVSTTIDEERSNSETLLVRQTIVRRDLVSAAAHRTGFPVDELSFVAAKTPTGSDLTRRILLHPERASTTSRMGRMIQALVVTAILIGLADLGVVWWTREATIADLDAQTISFRTKALAVVALEDQISKMQSSQQTLARKRAKSTTVELWRETSRILPENSWLTEWKLQDDAMAIAGLSAAATNLVGIFDKSTLFANASLNAPITTDPVEARERFSLIFHIRDTANVKGN